jgi:hypothetical protein
MDTETDVIEVAETDTADAGEAQAGAAANTKPPAGGPPRSKDGRYQGGQQAQAAAGKQSATPEKRRFKVKSKSGGEEEMEVDEAAIARALSFEREGHHRLRKLHEERQAFERERATFQQQQESLKQVWRDPAALRKFLHEQVTDPEEAHRIKVQLLKLDLQERQMSPEERELQQLRLEKSERETAEKQRAEEEGRSKAERDLQERVEKLRPVFVKTLSGVLDKGGLPVSERTLARAAEVWRDNKRAGVDLDEEELATCLKEELDTELDARMGDESLSDDAFQERYPKVMERAHRILVGRIKAKRTGARGGTEREPAVASRHEAKRDDMRRPPPKAISREEEKKLFGS